MHNNAEGTVTKAPSFTERLDARGAARNSGIDLLRLVAMFFVVILHTLGCGGAKDAAQDGTVQHVICTLFDSIAYCAVDIFALISGYVGYSDRKKPVRITGLLQMYLQVVTCGLFVLAAFLIVRPELVGIKHLVTPFFPITGDLYWYYTAYVGLFLVMPLLNAGLRQMPKRTLRVVLIAMLAAFSAYTVFLDRFKLEGGYSTIWLILLYFMGGILKKCEVGKRLKPWAGFLGIAALSCVTCLWSLYGVEFSFLVITLKKDLLLSYVSPTVLGSAILYLIAFSKLRFGKIMKRLIAFAAPCAFAVYLLNCNRLIWDHVMKDNFVFLGTASPVVAAAVLLGFPAGFVAASVLLDRVRLLAFDLLRIPQLLSSIDRAAHKAVERFIPND